MSKNSDYSLKVAFLGRTKEKGIRNSFFGKLMVKRMIGSKESKEIYTLLFWKNPIRSRELSAKLDPEREFYFESE